MGFFVHGAVGGSAVWFRQIRAFQQQHNVLLLDLRGHGKSNQLVKSFVGSHYSFNKVSEDIIDVLDHNNIVCVHFVYILLAFCWHFVRHYYHS
jgi:pimeloyl-ACP methyl ester carboxylesterase